MRLLALAMTVLLLNPGAVRAGLVIVDDTPLPADQLEPGTEGPDLGPGWSHIGALDRLALPEPETPSCESGREGGVTRGLFVAAEEGMEGLLPRLQGAINDGEVLRNSLALRGADPRNLLPLTGRTATRAGVEAALGDLLRTAGCGDSVILQFSAHSLPAKGRLGPWIVLNPSRGGGVLDLLSATALARAVEDLRARGADVSVILDVSFAESFALEGQQRQLQAMSDSRMGRYRLSGSDEPPAAAVPGVAPGDLTVFYGSEAGADAHEQRLPLDQPDAKVFGLFSFYMAAAISDAERSTPPALMRHLRKSRDVNWSVWVMNSIEFVISSTDPDQLLVAEEGRAAGGVPLDGPGAEVIRILSPAVTRAAEAMETPSVLVEGRVESAARTLIVLVNGEEAEFGPDGRFRYALELEAGVNAVKVLAMTETNRPITTEFELYYEGDVDALVGTGRRYALLIANEDYAEGSGLKDLRTPLGDAAALGEVLVRDYGYVTQATTPEGAALDLTLENPTRLEIETALYDLSRIAGEKDSVLIFYAGHGIFEEATGNAYWLPADAAMDRPFGWLSAAAISDAILRINAGSLLLISDSCYSGALLRGGAVPAGLDAAVSDRDRLLQLQRTAAKRSRVLMTSGGNEPVLDGGGSGHSVFAAALLAGLAEMEDRAFTTAELFGGFVLPRVVGKATQEPQYRPIDRAGHEGGDVVWVRQGD